MKRHRGLEECGKTIQTHLGFFPGGPVAKTPCSQLGAQRLILGQGIRYPHAPIKSSHAIIKRFHMPQFRLRTAKEINILKKQTNKQKQLVLWKCGGCLYTESV